MIALYLLGIAVGWVAWQAPVDVEIATVTILEGDRTDIPLAPPAGEVEARRDNGMTRLEIRLDRTDPLAVFGPSLRAHVVWAVSPEGGFDNLGELHVDGRRAELDATTPLQRFGIIVTSEPYHSVDSPSGRIAARSTPPDDDDVRTESIRLTLVDDGAGSTLDLPPAGNLPPRVVQARAAFQIAESTAGEQFAQSEFRQARVAFESMEQLLRRPIDSDLLEEFVNDSIRLSARAIRHAREASEAEELRAMTRRAESAEARIDELQFDLRMRNEEVEELSTQLAALRTERDELANRTRELTFSRDEAERELRETDARLEATRDPWPPLLDALIAVGAQQVPRGARLVLGAGRFEDGEADFSEGTREALSRLVGILRFGPDPEIRIEGHTRPSGSTGDDLTLSEDRARAVMEYLVSAGVPEDRILAQGFGASRPVLGVEDTGDPANERVEITILEP